MFKRVTWYSLLTLTLLGALSLSLGFFKAIEVTGGRGTNPVAAGKLAVSPKPAIAIKAANTVKIVVMGDSIAYGTGDEKGRGLPTYLPVLLKPQTTKALTIENVGVNGMRIDGLRNQVKGEKLQALLPITDIVLISIGGNDLRELRSENNSLIKESKFKTLEADYLKNLQEIVAVIRKSSPNAYIVFLGLYNPYEKAGSFEDVKYLSLWNFDTQKLFEADARAIFIPTYDLYKFNIKRFLAPDGIHPNSLGYQTLSYWISKSIESSLME
jgi:lysophospholipase L1-like esterase